MMDTQALLDLLPNLGLAAVFLWFFREERIARDKERADALMRYDKNDTEWTSRYDKLQELYLYDMNNLTRLTAGLKMRDETRPVKDVPIGDAADYQAYLDSRK